MRFIFLRRARRSLPPHVGLVLFAAACARVPVPSDLETSRVFDSDFEHTWSAVIETSARLVVPAESVAKDSGRVHIFVERLSDRQTQVTVNSFFERTHVLPEQAGRYSTGRLESLFFAEIARNL